MNNKEKELVTEEYCSRIDTYNICPGGFGGFGYINSNSLSNPVSAGKLGGKVHSNRCKTDNEYNLNNLERFKLNVLPKRSIFKKGHQTWVGKKHKPESIEKMKQSSIGKHIGDKNSQFGTIWITNGQINKKIKKEEFDSWINLGFYKGRNIS